MTTLEILEAGRARIEKGWCQGHYALTAESEIPLSATGPPAAWCAIGALIDVQSRPFPREADNFLEAAVMEWSGYANVLRWNDEPGRTQADVLALYDRAIAKAKAAEAGR